MAHPPLIFNVDKVLIQLIVFITKLCECTGFGTFYSSNQQICPGETSGMSRVGVCVCQVSFGYLNFEELRQLETKERNK